MGTNNVVDALLDTFRRVHIDHVFRCKNCERFWLTKDLHKRHDGKYVCVQCNDEVEDVTFTAQGQSFIQIVKP